jgi:hypothetical protein
MRGAEMKMRTRFIPMMTWFLAAAALAAVAGAEARATCTSVIDLLRNFRSIRNGQPIRIMTEAGEKVEGTVVDTFTSQDGDVAIAVRDANGSMSYHYLLDLDPSTYVAPLEAMTAGTKFSIRAGRNSISGTFVEVKDGELIYATKGGKTKSIKLSEVDATTLSIAEEVPKGFSPTTATITDFKKNLTGADLDEADTITRQQLDELGVKYKKLGAGLDEEKLRSNFDIKLGRKNPGQAVEDSLMGRTFYYEVTAEGLPAAGQAHVTELAFRHPDLPKFMEELKAKGCRLVVDSSLPANLKAGAYYWPYNNVIALRPNATWQTFLHEFQHFEFNHFIRQRYGFRTLDEFVANVPRSIIDVIKRDDPRAFAAIELAKKGLPELAVNETLSVNAELKALKDAGYSRWGLRALSTRDYALYHQIKALKKIPKANRTLQQQSLLRRALLERYLLTNDAMRAVYLGAATALATTAGALKIIDLYFNPSSGKVRFIGSDGKVVEVDPVTSLEKTLPQDITDKYEDLPPDPPPAAK